MPSALRVESFLAQAQFGFLMWLAWAAWDRERDMIERGQEVGRVCLPPGKPVIANGVEWGCVGDAYVSYEQTIWIPND